MNSKSILKVDVGGQIFQTNVNTLCKYPDSMLCAMFSHTNSGLTPMPKTEKGHFFLDADPIYFRVILNWLRLGKVTLDNPGLLKGTMALAEYFGLDELTEELKVIEKKNDRKREQSGKMTENKLLFMELPSCHGSICTHMSHVILGYSINGAEFDRYFHNWSKIPEVDLVTC